MKSPYSLSYLSNMSVEEEEKKEEKEKILWTPYKGELYKGKAILLKGPSITTANKSQQSTSHFKPK